LYLLCRFMNYELLEYVIKEMAPGSLLLVVHFVEGKSHNSQGKSFKKKENLINDTFHELVKGMKIVIREEKLDEKQERTLMHFLGQKL
jgi:hypothetical protein